MFPCALNVLSYHWECWMIFLNYASAQKEFWDRTSNYMHAIWNSVWKGKPLISFVLGSHHVTHLPVRWILQFPLDLLLYSMFSTPCVLICVVCWSAMQLILLDIIATIEHGFCFTIRVDFFAETSILYVLVYLFDITLYETLSCYLIPGFPYKWNGLFYVERCIIFILTYPLAFIICSSHAFSCWWLASGRCH